MVLCFEGCGFSWFGVPVVTGRNRAVSHGCVDLSSKERLPTVTTEPLQHPKSVSATRVEKQCTKNVRPEISKGTAAPQINL